jgi:hypothetical protein
LGPDVTSFGQDDQCGERAGAGQLGEYLDRRLGPGPPAHLQAEDVLAKGRRLILAAPPPAKLGYC